MGRQGGAQPTPSAGPAGCEIAETACGLDAETVIAIGKPDRAGKIAGDPNLPTRRDRRNRSFPRLRRGLRRENPSGVRRIAFTSATPSDVGRIHLARLLFRNDRQMDVSAQELIRRDAETIV